MDKLSIEAALVKEACLACGKLIDSAIIMNTILTVKEAEKVKEMHGKCIGYSEELCDTCKDLCSKGLLVIEIDITKSEPNNPYRTRFIFVFSNESELTKYFREQCSNFIIKKGNSEFIFLDKEVVNDLQIPRNNIE